MNKPSYAEMVAALADHVRLHLCGSNERAYFDHMYSSQFQITAAVLWSAGIFEGRGRFYEFCCEPADYETRALKNLMNMKDYDTVVLALFGIRGFGRESKAIDDLLVGLGILMRGDEGKLGPGPRHQEYEELYKTWTERIDLPE